MVKTAYSNYDAVSYDRERFTDSAGKRIHDIEVNVLKQALHLIDNKGRIAEIGCGTGRIIQEIKSDTLRITGFDASRYMLQQGQNKFGKGNNKITLCNSESKRLPLNDDALDLVYSIRVLNQTESAQYALDSISEIIRVTKPGGFVLVEFMNFYRMRLFSADTRLTPKAVAYVGLKKRAKLIWLQGRFFLGMKSYQWVPRPLIGVAAIFDSLLSKMFPRMCSRCYALFQKS